MEQVTTKRRVLGQVMVCNGCCCGRTEKGKPGIPMDRLKSRWKEEKLLKSVQLTITGCLGPCDIANVVSIQTPEGPIWLGRIEEEADYDALIDWAIASRDEERLQALPERLLKYRFERFSAEAVAK
ncbi:(2Fe-2S) ferredoxin domain-containing protein [Paenibacillus massiliensis]|uniref:(2Fe-2S) ferredoxin domain-containing protein n=1 Tax=Paenibacillus massiliensis TaxID=225917 RepID=UPI000360F2D8|nr:(2Fe-2S) ferredoxin domain-containing protein [Paenibacillus massiliensis]